MGMGEYVKQISVYVANVIFLQTKAVFSLEGGIC